MAYLLSRLGFFYRTKTHQRATRGTLPVEKNGLQGNALSVLASMLRNHVTLASINIMTMDYTSVPAGTSMGQAAENALNATARQLGTVYPQYGIKLSTRQIWQRLGATVMIGQNDQQGQNFSVADAQSLASFANANHLGRLSMWDINRDAQCGSTYPETGLLSNTCSGTTQTGRQFAWQSPWELLGPVVPGEGQSAIFTLPSGSYPAWAQGKAYHTGDKVLYQGLPYQAKWANQGVSPATEASDPSGSPWKALYTIPGEPSGSPAIGVTASLSPSSAVPTTSPSATGSTGATG
jgi:chitinase